MPDKQITKFKEKRSAIKSVEDVVSLLRTQHDFDQYSLEYYDIEFNTVVLFSQHTFEDADFANAKCVRMRILNLSPENSSASSHTTSHANSHTTSHANSYTSSHPTSHGSSHTSSHGGSHSISHANPNRTSHTISPIVVTPNTSSPQRPLPIVVTPHTSTIDNLPASSTAMPSNLIASGAALAGNLVAPNAALTGNLVAPCTPMTGNLVTPSASNLDNLVSQNDDNSSQSASSLDNLVPGIPIDFIFPNPSGPPFTAEDAKPAARKKAKPSHRRTEISDRYINFHNSSKTFTYVTK